MGNLCCSNNRKIERDTSILEKQIPILTLNNAKELDLYSKKIIKILHNNTVPTFLLEDNIVMKRYNLETNYREFDNEKETYRRLKALPFILKPIHISTDTIFLPFIKSKPEKTPQNIKTVKNYLNILETQFGIVRRCEYQWNNLLQCPKTKQIYLISFGNIPCIHQLSRTKWVISDSFSYNSKLSISK